MKKQLLSKIWKILFLSSLLFQLSCSSITKIDKPFCIDETNQSGFCVLLVSGKQFHVDDAHPFIDEDGVSKTWYDMQLGIIKIPLETFKAMKKYLIDECKNTGKCDANIDSWDRNLSTLELK